MSDEIRYALQLGADAEDGSGGHDPDCWGVALSALSELEAERDTLRAALAWYANPNRYRVGKWPDPTDHPHLDASILPDGGERARAALAVWQLGRVA